MILFTRLSKAAIGIFGVSGVILGALGAHLLRPQLTASGQVETWQTAVVYHLIHTVAALALWVYLEAVKNPPRLAAAALLSWLTGVLFFSGSLYVLALGGPRWLGPVTPCGGLLLIFGWSCLLLATFRRES